jgi:hypothetical protein
MTIIAFRWLNLIRPASALLTAAAIGWCGQFASAQEPTGDSDSSLAAVSKEEFTAHFQPGDDRPSPPHRDAGPPRDRGQEGRRPRDDDRGPADRGRRDSDLGPADRGPRDNERGPHEGNRGPRDGDRGPDDRRGSEDRGPGARGPADHGPPGRGFGGGFGGARGFGGPMQRFAPPGGQTGNQGPGSIDERIARLEHKLDAILMELHQLRSEHHHPFGPMAQHGPGARHGMDMPGGGPHPPMGPPPFARHGGSSHDHQGPPHMQGPPHGSPPHFGPPRGPRGDGPRDRDDDDDGQRGRAERDRRDSDRPPPPRGAQRERADDDLAF